MRRSLICSWPENRPCSPDRGVINLPPLSLNFSPCTALSLPLSKLHVLLVCGLHVPPVEISTWTVAQGVSSGGGLHTPLIATPVVTSCIQRPHKKIKNKSVSTPPSPAEPANQAHPEMGLVPRLAQQDRARRPCRCWNCRGKPAWWSDPSPPHKFSSRPGRVPQWCGVKGQWFSGCHCPHTQ